MLNDLPDYAFVIARGSANKPHFRAVKLSKQTGSMQSLVWDGEYPVDYSTYGEARKVADLYNEGPQDSNVRSATWHNQKNDWGWEVTDTFPSRRSGHRGEDFHSDI